MELSIIPTPKPLRECGVILVFLGRGRPDLFKNRIKLGDCRGDFFVNQKSPFHSFFPTLF